MTQGDLAERLKVGQAAVSKWESGKDKPSLDNLKAIADWTGLTIEQLTGGQLNPVLGLQALKVIGVVQAGAWVEETELDEADQFEISVPPSQKYPGIKRFGVLVRGPSMNLMFKDGAILICVSPYDLARDPRSGDCVICRRTNGDGLYEVTCKEFYMDDNGRNWLVPRSSDPQFQSPILVDAKIAAEVEITGIVTGVYHEI